MVATQQGLTLEEFLALPEEKPALEYAELEEATTGGAASKRSRQRRQDGR